jgi:hypothetical protein
LLTTLPLIKNVLAGYDSTLFVYGQTGTGKTHTMGLIGKLENLSTGIIPDSLRYIFQHFEKKNTGVLEWDLGLNFMQIYMEDIFDLFNPRMSSLKIREDTVSNSNVLFFLQVRRLII